MSIPAAVFKAECLKLMDEVARTGRSVVITKHGKPVAQLAPVATEPSSFFGYMRNTVQIKGDVVAATGERWDAISGGEDPLPNSAPKKASARHPKK
jgi:prevent-host-death family protein